MHWHIHSSLDDMCPCGGKWRVSEVIDWHKLEEYFLGKHKEETIIFDGKEETRESNVNHQCHHTAHWSWQNDHDDLNTL